MTFIEVKNIKKVYRAKLATKGTEALSDVNFSVNKGEFIAIMGESGSGKTTLLNILSTLDKPSSGEVYLEGQPLSKIKDKEISRFRRDTLGFVFQDFNLLDTFNLKDNIFLPLVLSGTPVIEMEKRLLPIAKNLGIHEQIERFPYEVSGGQKQRAAVARALITQPKVLLADEPTGALDYNTSKEILKLIEDVNKKYGNTIIMVTHNEAIKNMADHVIKLRDGAVRHNERNEHKISAADLEW